MFPGMYLAEDGLLRDCRTGYSIFGQGRSVVTIIPLDPAVGRLQNWICRVNGRLQTECDYVWYIPII